MSPELESNMNVFYHLTSVFDTSIYEALSKVIQKLIPEQAMLERLLDLLCQVRRPLIEFWKLALTSRLSQQCSMDKAFIFETASKIYIATDSAPLDNQTYVICADYLDLVGDFAQLYECVAAGFSFLSSIDLRRLAERPLCHSRPHKATPPFRGPALSPARRAATSHPLRPPPPRAVDASPLQLPQNHRRLSHPLRKRVPDDQSALRAVLVADWRGSG